MPAPSPTGPGPRPGPGSAGNDEQLTDGRQLRRVRNREAVVEALLDLYREGNLEPNSEEIADRSGLSPRSLFRYFEDVDDLVRAAIERQTERALPFVPIAASPDDPLDERISVLVGQRFSLFDVVGNAAMVARLRSPFQPLLARELAQNRQFLRSQLRDLFARELELMEDDDAAATLAAIDVLTTFESYRLLRAEQRLSPEQAQRALSMSLAAILRAASAGSGQS